MDIPVFHDDQHGTAVICLAGLINACHITGRKIEDTKIVMSGAGAAGLATINLLHKYGIQKKNIVMCDINGVVYKGRRWMNIWLEEFATDRPVRTLDEAIVGADVFIGVSVANVLKEEAVKKMKPSPIIFAMANPDPEIAPEAARRACPNAIIGTGRSDLPN